MFGRGFSGCLSVLIVLRVLFPEDVMDEAALPNLKEVTALLL